MINLYLDKNYLQNFTNSHKSNNSVFKKVLDQLLVLQKDNKIRVMRSSIHEIECGSEPFDNSSQAVLNRKILRITLPKIKAVRLIDYDEIKDRQFIGYLFKFLGINKKFNFSDIEIIDEYQGYDYHPWWFKNPSNNNGWFNSESIQALNDRIKNGKMNAEQWFEAELDFMKKDFFKRYIESKGYFLTLKNDLGIDESQIKYFLNSKQFINIPFVYIFCRISAKFSSQEQNAYKDDLNHDLFDTIAVSAYLPYCEVFCTDNEIKTYIKEAKFNYQPQVYSAKNQDVEAFLSFLKEI